jgi:CHAD domain-containing protein
LDLVKQYANSVVDRFQAQVQHEVLDNEWKGLEQLNRHLGEVRDVFENDIHRIASSLVNNRLPTVRKSDKQQKDKDAKALLGTSLLGRSKQ